MARLLRLVELIAVAVSLESAKFREGQIMRDFRTRRRAD